MLASTKPLGRDATQGAVYSDLRASGPRAVPAPVSEPARRSAISVFVDKLRRRLAKDSGVPLSQRLMENGLAALRYVRHAGSATFTLRACTQVGPWARTSGGAPFIDNRGSIVLGSHVLLMNDFSPVQLSAAPRSSIEIGDRTIINFGTMVSAHARVSIGADVSFGPYCIVCDHSAPSQTVGDVPALPITIEDGVWLAGRVTVLPGARVGARSVVTAGSIVSGDIPAGVIAGGNPARVLRKLGANDRKSIEEEAAAIREELAAPVPPASARPPSPALAALPVRGSATHTALIVADFTPEGLAQQLTDDVELPWVDADVAPFDQVIPTLMTLAQAPTVPDVIVVWARPETCAPSFQRVLRFERVDEQALLVEVDAYADLLARALAACKCGIVPTFSLPPFQRGLGAADTRPGGVTRLLHAMNLRLMQRFEASAHVHVLHAQRWQELAGHHTQSPRLWYMGKVGFHSAAFAEAVADIKATVRGMLGQARKLVVVDLDDTMWGGILGDEGWENLRLGGHDGVGEAFRDFQQALKNLKQRGILLAIASKNDEATALDAIAKHPEMVLRQRDFVGFRINWTDKAANIADLTRELNLGLSSVVFIDDNPVERGRVREQLPEVFVPEWPEDKMMYASALQSLRCFDSTTLTDEDRDRTALYAAERERVQQPAIGSHEDWVKSLELRVRVAPLDATNTPRASQLFNKTNQLNLTTRRLTQNELVEWASQTNRELTTISVADKFGDAGLTGIVAVERRGQTAYVVDYLLSCRVMGRQIEETLVHLAVESARRLGADRVEARLIPTAKNKPCLTFWQRSGFESPEENLFVWNVSSTYACPPAVTLQF